jgi:2-methylisocitrate lyase-like PEP mutase family enzyme
MRPQAAAMKALLDQPLLQIVPGCGDGMGARLVQEAGFRIGFAAGSHIHAMRLAMPDMDLLSFPEMRDAVESMVNAAPGVLWLADGDTGYGNAISVQRTVREYARAGAAAVLIEDKIWPRPLGEGGAKLVVERDEALLRIRAAIQTAREEGVLLLARTDACRSRGFDEALTRLKAFAAEGADILFLDSPQNEAQLRAAVEASGGKPAVAVTTPAAKHFMPDAAGLTRAGIRFAIHPHEILAATVHAVRAALAGLNGGPPAAMASVPELATAMRSVEYLAKDARLAGK